MYSLENECVMIPRDRVMNVLALQIWMLGFPAKDRRLESGKMRERERERENGGGGGEGGGSLWDEGRKMKWTEIKTEMNSLPLSLDFLSPGNWEN